MPVTVPPPALRVRGAAVTRPGRRRRALEDPCREWNEAEPQATLQPFAVVFTFVVCGAVKLLVGYSVRVIPRPLLWCPTWPCTSLLPPSGAPDLQPPQAALTRVHNLPLLPVSYVAPGKVT